MIAEASLVPIILGIVEAVKRAGMPSDYAPLLSVALGVAGGLLFISLDLAGGVTGLISGLGASGLYSGGKKLLTD